MTNLQKRLKDIFNPNKYVQGVHTREAYWALPLEQRTRKVWYWPAPWYIYISSLPFDLDAMRNQEKSEFDLFDEELAKAFPIQFFIREGWQNIQPIKWILRECRFLGYRYRDFYYKWIKRTFQPFNKDIRAQIPSREWKDKTTMIPDVLYAMIIDFVEKERGAELDEIVYNKEDKYGENVMIEEQNKQKRMIISIYGWAKSGRAYTQEKIDEALTEASENRNKGLTYEERYGEMEKLEKYLEKKDTEYLTWIVVNREFLWT